MVLLYCALLSAAGEPSPVRAEQRSRASVTVIRPHKAMAGTWKPASRRDQREVVKWEKEAGFVLLRLTEFE
jgi:hypothetical protein